MQNHVKIHIRESSHWPHKYWEFDSDFELEKITFNGVVQCDEMASADSATTVICIVGYFEMARNIFI